MYEMHKRCGMANREAVFAVLEILKKYDNPKGLTHNQIMEYLENDYDIKFKREKFAAIIEQINNSAEYEVEYKRGRYSSYRLKLKNALSSTEAELLCALIADTDILSRLEAEQLIDKLCITFNTSFDSEEQIEEIKSKARTGKNEVNGIEKLELIDFAIKNKLYLRFKLYNGESFSERIIDIPISWSVSAGDLVVRFANGEYKLSQIIDLRAEKNEF